MSDEVTLAMMAAITSLVVALIGLVTSIITNRHSARSDKTIESMKFEFSRLMARDSFSDAHLEDTLKALQSAIRTIQVVKDEIQLILSATGTSLDATSAISRIESAREKMFSCFEDAAPTLSEWESRAVHRAKNLSLIAATYIKNDLQEQTAASSLSAERHQQLMQVRSELSEMQQILRDSRMDRMFRRIGNDEHSES
jgi:hypothetical protein